MTRAERSPGTIPYHEKRALALNCGGNAVTDLVTTSESEDAAASGAPVQWAPAEPPAKKRRNLWLWIGIPAAAVAAGAVAASLVLIAPGTAVAGVPVGFLTPGAATDTIDQRLATTTVVLGDGGPSVSGADLGATVDAKALADAAFDAHPMWNVTQWFSEPAAATISLDPAAATAALRAALPSDFVDPVGATVDFTGKTYEVTPAQSGTGIDLDALTAELGQAFAAGAASVTIDPTPVAVEAAATTEAAQGVADSANAMIKNAGFYVGDERTVPVAAKDLASWLTITSDDTGAFTITADAAKIQPDVDALKGEIDQKAADGTVVTNSDGTVLRTIVPGQDGRVLGDTSNAAQEYATQLASGNAVYTLPVDVTPATTTKVERLLEVDLGDQRLYLKENGKVVDSWLISSGVDQSPTYEGRFRINSHITSQTMTSTDPDNPYWNYDVPNVQWVMYFNGDQAFHGVYWHSAWGEQRSHGCVGMSNARAKQIYDWAPEGVDVWIHA